MGPPCIKKVSHNMAHTLTKERKHREDGKGERSGPTCATRLNCAEATSAIDGRDEKYVKMTEKMAEDQLAAIHLEF